MIRYLIWYFESDCDCNVHGWHHDTVNHLTDGTWWWLYITIVMMGRDHMKRSRSIHTCAVMKKGKGDPPVT